MSLIFDCLCYFCGIERLNMILGCGSDAVLLVLRFGAILSQFKTVVIRCTTYLNSGWSFSIFQDDRWWNGGSNGSCTEPTTWFLYSVVDIWIKSSLLVSLWQELAVFPMHTAKLWQWRSRPLKRFLIDSASIQDGMTDRRCFTTLWFLGWLFHFSVLLQQLYPPTAWSMTVQYICPP